MGSDLRLTSLVPRPLRGRGKRIHELRALVPSGLPMMALTATVTKTMRKEVITSLDMEGCSLVLESPNREIFSMQYVDAPR